MGEKEEEEELKKIGGASSYDYENDSRWSDYWSNILIPPHMSSRSDVIDHYKRKFYHRYIDPDFVVEPMTTQSTSARSSTPPPSSSTTEHRPSRNSGSTTRAAGASTAATPSSTPLRWDRQTIQFSVNAWVLVVAVLAMFPLLPKSLSSRAYRLSFMGTLCSSLYSLYSLYGKPRAWNLQALQVWLQSVVATKDFIYFIYCITFVSSNLQLRFALLPILCRTLEHSAKFVRRNFSQSSWYRKYLEELCVWVESNMTTLSILSSQAEIGIGFLLILKEVLCRLLYLKSLICSCRWQRNIIQTFMYWQLLKLMYHAPVTAGYHQNVWVKVGVAPSRGGLMVKELASVTLKGVRFQVRLLLGANNSEVATLTSLKGRALPDLRLSGGGFIPLRSKSSSTSVDMNTSDSLRSRTTTRINSAKKSSSACLSRSQSFSRDIGHAASETYLITRLAFTLLNYLGVGRRWMLRLLALALYAMLLLPGLLRVVYKFCYSNNVRRSIVYGDQPRNRLDLYLPENIDGPKPVAVFVTGGAWIIGYKGWGALLGLQLAERDIIVASIDYRNFPQGTISDMVEDVSQGISFVCKNIAEYGGDPNRIYLMGQSAGAHISSCVLFQQALKESKGESTSWSVSQIKAYFGLSGGYNLLNLVEHFDRRGLHRSIFLSMMEGEDSLKQFSPDILIEDPNVRNAVSILPHVLLFHGTEDLSIPPDASISFVDTLKRVGARAELILFNGKTHTDLFVQDPLRGGKDELFDYIADYIHAGDVNALSKVAMAPPRERLLVTLIDPDNYDHVTTNSGIKEAICERDYISYNPSQILDQGLEYSPINRRRWQKKMHFMLSNMSVVYVLTTPMPEDVCENPTVEQVRKRAKWGNDDYVCRGLILNGMSDSLFDIYKNVKTSKELWDTLEAKYMAEDASNPSGFGRIIELIPNLNHLMTSSTS
nr:probable isoprenylcysteine alpha-carbonyl methylesterase ICMEL2 [Tanacetum cinerariifolium]